MESAAVPLVSRQPGAGPQPPQPPQPVGVPVFMTRRLIAFIGAIKDSVRSDIRRCGTGGGFLPALLYRLEAYETRIKLAEETSNWLHVDQENPPATWGPITVRRREEVTGLSLVIDGLGVDDHFSFKPDNEQHAENMVIFLSCPRHYMSPDTRKS